jgi:dihydrodipicolinate synthase/N-acetylneuraminate lyase
MKEVLKLQGLFPHATVREPQLPVDDAERAEIARLARQAGLVGTVPLRAVGD